MSSEFEFIFIFFFSLLCGCFSPYVTDRGRYVALRESSPENGLRLTLSSVVEYQTIIRFLSQILSKLYYLLSSHVCFSVRWSVVQMNLKSSAKNNDCRRLHQNTGRFSILIVVVWIIYEKKIAICSFSFFFLIAELFLVRDSDWIYRGLCYFRLR